MPVQELYVHCMYASLWVMRNIDDSVLLWWDNPISIQLTDLLYVDYISLK